MWGRLKEKIPQVVNTNKWFRVIIASAKHGFIPICNVLSLSVNFEENREILFLVMIQAILCLQLKIKSPTKYLHIIYAFLNECAIIFVCVSSGFVYAFLFSGFIGYLLYLIPLLFGDLFSLCNLQEEETQIEEIPRVQTEVQTERNPEPNIFPKDSKYEQFFMNFPHPVFLIDLNIDPKESLPTIFNPSAEKLEKEIKARAEDFFGRAKLEFSDCTLTEYIRSARRKIGETVLKWDRVRISPSKRGGFNQRQIENNQLLYEISSTTYEFEDERRMLGIMFLEMPLEAKKEMQTLEHFKISLSCCLSHELCTPINSLIPLLKMMPSCISEEGEDDVKEVALSSAEILHSKVRDLIDYNKIQLNELRIEEGEFSVNELFKEIYFTLRFEAKHKRNLLEFKINVQGYQQLIINSDRLRLKQILVKLISNAIKFTNEGSIYIYANENEKNLDTEFRIEDTGVGISKEKLDILFASLSRKAKLLHQDSRGSTKMPGLGLEISKEICASLGGNLQVTSEIGKGTKFSFILPTSRVFVPFKYSFVKKKKKLLTHSDIQEAEKQQETLVKIDHTEELKTDRSQKLAGRRGSVDIRNQRKLLSGIIKNSDRLKLQPNAVEQKQYGSEAVKNSPSEGTSIISIPQKLCLPKSKFAESSLKLPKMDEEEKAPIEQISPSKKIARKLSSEKFPKVIELQSKAQEGVNAILIADDTYGNRFVLKEMIRKLGIPALEAINGREAVDIIGKSIKRVINEKIKLVLMDLDMPILDGIEATREIRTFEKERSLSSSIPIIAVTANNTESDKKESMNAGMQAFVTKPVDINTLNRIIFRYFNE